jgi:hypothetical protein
MQEVRASNWKLPRFALLPGNLFQHVRERQRILRRVAGEIIVKKNRACFLEQVPDFLG